MEWVGVATTVIKALVAILPFFFYWLGYSRGKKSGYAKGRDDAQTEFDRKMADLADKLYNRPDFGVRLPGAWDETPKTNLDLRVVTDGTASGWGQPSDS